MRQRPYPMNLGDAQARVIQNYDALSEPQGGYLGLRVGTMVTVKLDSRSLPERGSRSPCDYIFAWLPGQRETQGWGILLGEPKGPCSHAYQGGIICTFKAC